MALEFLTGRHVTINQKFMAELWKEYAQNSFGTFSRKRGVWAPSKLQRWKEALEKGDVVVAPAEGVYGYCCDPFNEKAVRKLCSLKNRTVDKGLVILVRTLEEVDRFIDYKDYEKDIQQAMEQHWPAQITLVLPVKDTIPGYLTGYRKTIALRIPKCPHMQQYLKKWNKPLVSSSLNLSGEAPVRLARHIPTGPISLTMEHRLKGSVSRIFNVVTGTWLR